MPFCEGGYVAGDADASSEAICAGHWKLIDKPLKALRTRALNDGDRVRAMQHWRRMSRQAVERAAGIA